jgi:hypothetical protein
MTAPRQGYVRPTPSCVQAAEARHHAEPVVVPQLGAKTTCTRRARGRRGFAAGSSCWLVTQRTLWGRPMAHLSMAEFHGLRVAVRRC